MATQKRQINKKAAKIKSKRQLNGIKNILVPIDFSTNSRQALGYAVSISQKYKLDIHLIYVVEPTIYPTDFSFGQIVFPNVEEELQSRGETELKNIVKKFIANKIRTDYAVRTGKPFIEITQYAKEVNIDLIVIATHGHTGMEHVIFGGTAEKVVRKASCPVLVVRALA